MKHRVVIPILFVLAALSVPAEEAAKENFPMKTNRPVHTYSVVARDPATGEMGVAVQSHWFSVGSIVTWGEAGVGVAATQSFADPAYGPRGLALMRSGMAAPDALTALIVADQGREVRQVAFLDAKGKVSAHTGKKCIDSAGHATGEGWSVQANMMASDAVVPAMARAMETAKGTLAERLLAALEAAEAAGGDVRGRQSAAMLVVKGAGTGRPWSGADVVLELRVEDHAEPLKELRRLMDVQQAYARMNAGDAALEHGDMKAAMEHYAASAGLAGGNAEILYWQAVTLAINGKFDEALPIFRKVFAADPRWAELTKRLHKPGIIPDTEDGRALVGRILKEAATKEKMAK